MNEVSVNLYCVLMRSGVEIWIEQEKALRLQGLLENITDSRFIRYEDRTINTADISGIFTATDMNELTRRKNGQWKCSYNNWHERNIRCECSFEKRNKELLLRTQEMLKIAVHK